MSARDTLTPGRSRVSEECEQCQRPILVGDECYGMPIGGGWAFLCVSCAEKRLPLPMAGDLFEGSTFGPPALLVDTARELRRMADAVPGSRCGDDCGHCGRCT